MTVILFLGSAICGASGLMFNYHLIRLNSYLKDYHPELWKEFGTGNRNLHFLAKLHRIKTLATEYETDDPGLQQKFKMLTVLNWGIGMGAILIVIAVVVSLASS